MAGPRNRHGLNDAADCYRTFGGEKYAAWMSYPSADRVRAYRAAGVRCRRQGTELFVHWGDHDAAAEVDAQQERANP